LNQLIPSHAEAGSNRTCLARRYYWCDCVQVVRERELVYQGKALSVWLQNTLGAVSLAFGQSSRLMRGCSAK
jgi:hypothetical protein